jgi:minimal PKS acyl carrier protein
MAKEEMTINALVGILTSAAGEAAPIGAGDHILDTKFTDLGYDSIALLETAARIEQEYGITFDDDAVTSAITPRLLIAAVNDRLT